MRAVSIEREVEPILGFEVSLLLGAGATIGAVAAAREDQQTKMVLLLVPTVLEAAPGAAPTYLFVGTRAAAESIRPTLVVDYRAAPPPEPPPPPPPPKRRKRPAKVPAKAPLLRNTPR